MRTAILFLLLAAAVASTAELGRVELREPAGVDWPDEWVRLAMTLTAPAAGVAVADLRLVDPDGKARPVQWYRDGKLLAGDERLTGEVKLEVFTHVALKAGKALELRAVDDAGLNAPPAIVVVAEGASTTIANGVWEIGLDTADPLPLNTLRVGGTDLGTFAWPDGIAPTSVTDSWLERGPAQVVLRRDFAFADPQHRYRLTLTARVGDPWIDLVDEYALGRGTAITLDLRALTATHVFHPHSYSPRSISAGGQAEDSTLEPPQHPIATLGPIWRDIWMGGGPHAFVYREGAAVGVGLAATRGSRWTSPDEVSLESQNLKIHGDKVEEGRVIARLPTDAGTRHWALVLGHPDLRQRLGTLQRARADIPLQKVLDDWVLDWESQAEEVKNGFASFYLTSHYNMHIKCPTTVPRRVKRSLPATGPVKSRDLAVLAYVFTDPDYWPGPQYRWQIGNPNFHTDMWPTPFRIGLLMPDHPHARRWVEHGITNIDANLHGASFLGGAWAESLSYSGAYFGVLAMARQLKAAGDRDLVAEWPRFRESITYLACMHTPVDRRYGCRQKAPIGDTSPGNYVKQINAAAEAWRGVDAVFAEQLARFPEQWDGALDLSSRAFPGFGAMLRGNAYDERHESFVTFKAGPARNHFQGDELSVSFASLGVPLAIDYACHYSPRPWHAAMHNRPDLNDQRPVAIGIPRRVVISPVADAVVADERTREINQVPLLPEDTSRPGWEYPTTRLDADHPWTFRRWAMLVKHDPATGGLADYLVLRDEIDAPEPVRWNLHLLVRDLVRQEDQTIFRCPGQLDVDLDVHVFGPIGKVELKRWGWRDSRSQLRRSLKGEDYRQIMYGADLPENLKPGGWKPDESMPKDTIEHWLHTGESSRWLRLHGPADRSDWLVLLVPYRKGTTPPTVERLSSTSARISLGDESEVVHLGSEGEHQAAVVRGETTTALVAAGAVPPWDELDFIAIPADLDRGGR